MNIKDPEINTKNRQIIDALRERVLEFRKTPHTAKGILPHTERTYQYRNIQIRRPERLIITLQKPYKCFYKIAHL